jgi:outer membrane autotransporter protein
LGGRYAWESVKFRPYVGMAWEHEFDGTANSTTFRCPIDALDMRGDTGIFELGFTFRPSENMPLFIDLNAQGYAGSREGLSGTLEFEYYIF